MRDYNEMVQSVRNRGINERCVILGATSLQTISFACGYVRARGNPTAAAKLAISAVRGLVLAGKLHHDLVAMGAKIKDFLRPEGCRPSGEDLEEAAKLLEDLTSQSQAQRMLQRPVESLGRDLAQRWLDLGKWSRACDFVHAVKLDFNLRELLQTCELETNLSAAGVLVTAFEANKDVILHADRVVLLRPSSGTLGAPLHVAERLLECVPLLVEMADVDNKFDDNHDGSFRGIYKSDSRSYLRQIIETIFLPRTEIRELKINTNTDPSALASLIQSQLSSNEGITEKTCEWLAQLMSHSSARDDQLKVFSSTSNLLRTSMVAAKQKWGQLEAEKLAKSIFSRMLFFRGWYTHPWMSGLAPFSVTGNEWMATQIASTPVHQQGRTGPSMVSHAHFTKELVLELKKFLAEAERRLGPDGAALSEYMRFNTLAHIHDLMLVFKNSGGNREKLGAVVAAHELAKDLGAAESNIDRYQSWLNPIFESVLL
ncbi:hypothetical protein H4CHR_02746 [Variovorax sp. PBS-H4]|nr:hypothetical protein H4CHR_02746 [Variovorax sp. PBS-H4]